MSRKNDHYRAFNIRQFPDRAVCYLLLYLYSLLHLCNQADFTCCIGDTIWHGFAGGGRAGLETTPARSLPRIDRELLTGLGVAGWVLPPCCSPRLARLSRPRGRTPSERRWAMDGPSARAVGQTG